MRNQWMCLLGLATLAGCASASKDIAPAYVSPLVYDTYTCPQLTAEAQRLSGRAAEASGAQDSARGSDAAMVAVSAVIFWPALFFIKGDSAKASELARLKGEMEAVEQASIRKKCQITFRREEPPKT